MSKDDIKEVLIASICMWLLLFLLTGCSSIEIIHREGRMPKVEVESEFMDKLCTKDFDANIKTDQFIISCDIAL
jgi:hypothetical protein